MQTNRNCSHKIVGFGVVVEMFHSKLGQNYVMKQNFPFFVMNKMQKIF